MKINEAKFINSNGIELNKRTYKWEVPFELKKLNNKNKFRTIIGINQWSGTDRIYVALSQGNEIIYIEKSLWLEIAKNLKEKTLK